jgi:hypothetical protein
MKQSTDLILEVRSTDGAVAEFYQSDAERVAKVLRFLATPRLFTEPQLTLASEHAVTAIATRTIDVILARTNAPVPEVLPLKSPAGPIDICEIAHLVPEDDDSSIITEWRRERAEPANLRSFRVEVSTVGGWSKVLQVRAQVRGTVLDRRQTFAHIFQVPVIPFKLCTGGIGFINPSNLIRATASPAPDSLPETALAMEFLRWNPFPAKTSANLTAINR